MIFHSNIYFCLIRSFISTFLQVYQKGLPGVSKRYMPVSNWYVGVSKRLCIELTGYRFNPTIHLQSSKTDPFRSGCFIHIGRGVYR